MDTQEQIKKAIEDNSVMLFMKGNLRGWNLLLNLFQIK